MSGSLLHGHHFHVFGSFVALLMLPIGAMDGSFRSTAILSADAEAGNDFAAYKRTFGRDYADDSEEHRLREALYREQLEFIARHNSHPDSTWQAGINEFSDRSPEELAMSRGFRGSHRDESAGTGSSVAYPAGLSPNSFVEGAACTTRGGECSGESAGCCGGLICGGGGQCQAAPERLPESFDWAEKLSIGRIILDQRTCGSCWAMAATASAGFMAAIATNNTFADTLSPQSILCAPNPRKCGGTGACDGATSEMAYQEAMSKGFFTVDQLEYKAKAECSISQNFLGASRPPGSPAVTIGGYVRLPDNQAQMTMSALLVAGPPAVAVAAAGLHSYEKGIYNCLLAKPVEGASNASKDAVKWVVDHAVLLTGFGTTVVKGEIKKYWVIRNSWGTGWGMGGFFWLHRDYPDQEQCGWDNDPQKGVGCEGGPNRTYVCGNCGLYSDVSYPIKVKVSGRAV